MTVVPLCVIGVLIVHVDVSYNLSSDQRVFFGAGGEGSTLIRDSVIAVVNGTSSCNTHIVYLTVSVYV